MEDKKESPIEQLHTLKFKIIEEHITLLDLSNSNLSNIDENTLLPANLSELLIAHNNLTDIPMALLNLEKIKILDISYNNIKYFDETPKFYNVLTKFNISNNNLLGPPYWIWRENCRNLVELNISCNINVTNSFFDGYFEELLQYRTLVTNVIIYKCNLKKYIELLSTFPKAKVLKLGYPDFSFKYHSNIIEEIPCIGLKKLCDIETLELSNIDIYNVNADIIIFKNLKEINLSYNKLCSLPEEFCSLENLEICILSYNDIIYLPERLHQLEKLKILLINSNQLCMLPEKISMLTQLEKLDLYDNHLYESPIDINNIQEIDLAQNYFDEPRNEEYSKKKYKIRLNNPDRYDGRKIEVTRPESEYSDNKTDDEELINLDDEKSKDNEQDMNERCPSSPEDWDSDDYWIPHLIQTNSMQPSWLHFIKQKMDAGNFCPIDAHPVSISDQVNYEKLCNPTVQYESDGQFDDYSGDDS